MKRILTALTSGLILSNIGFAACPGAYLGLGGGVGQIATPNRNIFIVPAGGRTTNTQQGLSGRAFIGYTFIPYLGVEAGFARYARSLYTGSIPGFAYSSLTYYDRSYDVVGKAYLPVNNSNYNVYGLAGAARVTQEVRFVNGGIPMNSSIAFPVAGSPNYYITRPIYGLGISADFGNHIQANAEFTQIRSKGNISTSRSAMPNLNLLTLNIAYNFY